MKKFSKIAFALCVIAAVFGTFLFLPTSRFQISRSISPTGKGTLVAVTQPQTAPNGMDNSSTDLFIEDAKAARTFWFRCETGVFNPNDYYWSKDGSLVAAKLGWSVPINKRDTATGKDFLLSADVTNGETSSTSAETSVPSPADLRAIPQLLTKRGGAVAATWSKSKNLSWLQRLSYSKN